MNTRMLLLVLLVASLAVCSTALASSPADVPVRFSEQKLHQIEDNLLVCFASERPGVQISAALTLKQLKELAPEYSFSRCIIPLMAIVKNESGDESSRIVAGLALHVLSSDRGDYAIKWTAHFTEAQRVKHIYEWLTYERMLERLASR